MTNWHEPTRFNEWLHGVISPLHGMILMVILAVMVSEWQLNWCETLVGGYLAEINASRPETGTIWKTGSRSDAARSVLKNLIQERKAANRYARETTSFMELASGILPGQWTDISKQHFKRLYLALPESTAFELLPPLELVWLFSGTRVSRIFCEGKASGLELYFLTPENNVVKKLFFSRKTLSQLDETEIQFKGALTDIPTFKGTRYAAGQFFQALLAMPRETCSRLIFHPERLIREKDRLIRVGIWQQDTTGYQQMGFEFQTPEGPLVIFVKGQQWAVQQLSQRLSENGQ